jgi:uncharacterized phage protein (TIGR01671 family)
MGRKIKFRAWDKIDNKMFAMGYNEGFWAFIEVESDRYEIMQFTGLHDEQDKEIYEGDIIEIPWKFNPKQPHRKCVVTFNNDNASFTANYKDKNEIVRFLIDCGQMQADNEKYKVIGNIYENPELLKEHKE